MRGLALDVFALRGFGSAVAFAQVSEQGGGADVDSSPGNASGSTAREDDEASLVFSVALGARATSLVVDEVRPAGSADRQLVTFTTRGGASADGVLVDPLGRELQRLRLEGEGDGTHSVEFSTADLSPGTYYLSVVTALGAEAHPVLVP